MAYDRTYELNAREGDVVDVPGRYAFVLELDARGDWQMKRVLKQDAPKTQFRKIA